LKEEALDPTLRRSLFVRGYGHLVRRKTRPCGGGGGGGGDDDSTA